VDKRPESVENRGRLWTSAPPRRRELDARRGRSDRRIRVRSVGRRPVHRRVHRAVPDSAIGVHLVGPVIHRAPPHAHEASSTASTPWWRWWRD